MGSNLISLCSKGEHVRRSFVGVIALSFFIIGTLCFGTGAAGDIVNLIERLNREPDILVIRDIAALKENGKSAGPSLVHFL